MPESKVRNNREKVDYSQWVEVGLIKTTPGNIIDHEFLTEDIREIATNYQLHSVAYDPYLAHHGVVQNLLKEGIEMNQMGQGFRQISEPTKEWERRLTENTIEHFNNPVLAWMNKSTTVIRDANRNIKIQKIDGEKGNLKIDGIASCINALAQCMSYEKRVNEIDIW
jgi:phage terminase large subunit-like protein